MGAGGAYFSRSEITWATALPGFFAVGDGAGVTRGLAQAGASGVKVAQVISERLK